VAYDPTMREGIVGALVVVGGLTLGAACSTFNSDDTSQATMPDAAVDAPATPDAAPSDAGAGDADDGSCATATGYLVCADFPDPGASLPTGGFDAVYGDPRSALTIEADPPGSSNYALHARGEFDGGSGQVYLYKDVAAAPQTLTFSATVRADAVIPNYVEMLSVATIAPTDFEVVVATTSGRLVVSDSTSDGDGGTTAAEDHTLGPFDATPSRVEVQLWFDATGTSIEIRKEGAVALPKMLLAAAGARVLAGRAIRFSAGVFYAGVPTNDGGAFLDDIRLAATP
jgi:hypothetical protein